MKRVIYTILSILILAHLPAQSAVLIACQPAMSCCGGDGFGAEACSMVMMNGIMTDGEEGEPGNACFCQNSGESLPPFIEAAPAASPLKDLALRPTHFATPHSIRVELPASAALSEIRDRSGTFLDHCSIRI